MKDKVRELRKIEKSLDNDEQKIIEKAKKSKFVKKMMGFRAVQEDFDFLDNPVDKAMLKLFFVENDKTMNFYENKYRFRLKDMRPFA